jgi:large subunit ribosomal protein L9
VRIILKEDLPDGRGYSGDVMTVKAGYARNYLVPKKMALYATPENFARLGVADPEAETMEEKRARLAAEAAVEEDEEAAADLRAADLLKHYLRNKVVSTMSAQMHVPD